MREEIRRGDGGDKESEATSGDKLPSQGAWGLAENLMNVAAGVEGRRDRLHDYEHSVQKMGEMATWGLGPGG